MHRSRKFGFGSLTAVVAALALFAIVHSTSTAAQTQAGAHAAIAGSRSPVLVELFTSEGCSDCPPADALLAYLDTHQPIPGADVMILELHVSYWNDDWRDPFSSMSYTERQSMYAYGHSGDQMYTPQMIVDGGARFIGSDSRQAQKAILQAVHTAKAPIELQWAGSAAGNQRLLHVKVDSLPAGDPDKPQVFLALTESHLHVNVRAGENSGKGLDHDGVVRKLSNIGKIQPHSGDPIFETQMQVKLEKDWKPENLRAIVFVQDPHSLRVLGAAEIPFTQ
jgi:hypothetical protein